MFELPGMHLRRFSTDDGLLRSAKNLYKSSSFNLSDSWTKAKIIETLISFYTCSIKNMIKVHVVKYIYITLLINLCL